MTATYLSKSGDVVDEIVKSYYGTLKGRMVEQVLDSNPGLADYGPILPYGVSIVLPDIQTPVQEASIRLWD